MKRKLVFVLVILSVMFAGTAFAGSYADGTAKRMKAARSVYDKILAKDNGCTLCDTRVAQSDYFVFLEKELNTVYKKIMALLPQKKKIACAMKNESGLRQGTGRLKKFGRI